MRVTAEEISKALKEILSIHNPFQLREWEEKNAKLLSRMWGIREILDEVYGVDISIKMDVEAHAGNSMRTAKAVYIIRETPNIEAHHRSFARHSGHSHTISGPPSPPRKPRKLHKC